MKEIKNRIIKSQLVEWKNILPLQPANIKLPENNKAIRESIIRHGIASVYHVWEDSTGDIYWLDGHTRTEELLKLEAEGYTIPKKLHAVFYGLDNREEAIKVLLSVYNGKKNAISEPIMIEWLEEEEIEVEEIYFEEILMENKLPVHDLEFDKSELSFSSSEGGNGSANEELENQYDDDDNTSEEGVQEGGVTEDGEELTMKQQKPADAPPEIRDTKVPIFFNVEKVVRSKYEGLKKAWKLKDSEMFTKLVDFFNDEYAE